MAVIFVALAVDKIVFRHAYALLTGIRFDLYFTELNEPNFLNPHLILLKTSDARLQKVAQDFLRVSDRVKMGIKSNVVSSDSNKKGL